MNEEHFNRAEAADCHLTSTSPPSNSRGWTSGLASCIVPSFWPTWSMQDGGSDAHAEQYRQDLATAGGEDLSDVEELGFLRFDALDNEKRPVVVVVGRAIPCALMDKERLYRYIILKLDRVASAGPFSVLYVHTAAAAKGNSPGSWWLLQKLKQLPQMYQQNLMKFRVLHTDLQTWTVMWALCPLFVAEFWSKVEFVPRVEFLDEHMSAARLHLPEFVRRHDGELEDQPLMDYGIVVSKEAIPPGMVLPA